MKVGQWEKRWIGRRLVKRFWKECYLLVMDVNDHIVVGEIWNTTTNTWKHGIFPLTDEWELWRPTAKEFIEALPVTVR